jgi:hypothetical protein
MRTRLPIFVASCVVSCVALFACADVQSAQALALYNPPAPPSSGLGAPGPCGVAQVSKANPADSSQQLIVYSPTGTGVTPLGGRCNDAKRPVVAVVHGLLAGLDAQLIGASLLYSDVIDHFVSTGNVVIFATWDTNTDDFAASFAREDASIVAAATLAPRGDFTRFGIVGHSMGGGATPFLAQRAAARGWGSTALWLFPIAPWYTAGVGTGPIVLPPQTRVVVENEDDDTFVDNRIGIEQFKALALPAAQKQHVTVRSQSRFLSPTLDAQHTAANSVIAPNDAIRTYGIFRVGDALQSCSLTGAKCNADLSYMGKWSDGQPVTPAISTDNPVDIGPKATTLQLLGLDGECTSPMNPRAANCGP